MKTATPPPRRFTPPENLRIDPSVLALIPKELRVTPEQLRSHRAGLELEIQTEGRTIPRPRLFNYHD